MNINHFNEFAREQCLNTAFSLPKASSSWELYYVPRDYLSIHPLEEKHKRVFCNDNDLTNTELAIKKLRTIGKYTFMDRAIIYLTSSSPEKTLQKYVFKHVAKRLNEEQLEQVTLWVPEKKMSTYTAVISMVYFTFRRIAITFTGMQVVRFCPAKISDFAKTILSCLNFGFDKKIATFFINRLANFNFLAQFVSFTLLAERIGTIATVVFFYQTWVPYTIASFILSPILDPIDAKIAEITGGDILMPTNFKDIPRKLELSRMLMTAQEIWAAGLPPLPAPLDPVPQPEMPPQRDQYPDANAQPTSAS